MNLYRLDREDGAEVCDMLGVALYRSAKDARTRAISHAQAVGMTVHVTRISGAGSMRRMYSVDSNGRCKRA